MGDELCVQKVGFSVGSASGVFCAVGEWGFLRDPTPDTTPEPLGGGKLVAVLLTLTIPGYECLFRGHSENRIPGFTLARSPCPSRRLRPLRARVYHR